MFPLYLEKIINALLNYLCTISNSKSLTFIFICLACVKGCPEFKSEDEDIIKTIVKDWIWSANKRLSRKEQKG